MRFSISLFCAVIALASSQKIDEETRKRLNILFGPPPNTTATTQGLDGRKGEGPTTELNLQPSDTNRPASNSPCKREDDGKDGVCVIYYQCDPLKKTIITDGSTLIDIRQRECDHYLEVCCLEELVDTTATPTPKPEPKPDPAKEPEEQFECGYSNPGAQSFRIVSDGATAESGEYPWMVAVLRRSNPGSVWTKDDYFGGGSIIHPRVVLTGAHKVDDKDPSEMKCRAGEWDTQTENEYYPYQERNVQKVVLHEEFYRPSVINNVALLFLEEPFEISLKTPHMAVACIGHDLPPANTVCESMGWGKEDFNNPDKYAAILKKVDLPLVSRQSCLDALRGTRLGSRFNLHKSFTCAGGKKGRDTCTGDGGSPLVCHIGDKKKGRYAIMGTVAWGIGCGEDGVPGIYASIPQFRNWITQKLKDDGLDAKSFEYTE